MTNIQMNKTTVAFPRDKIQALRTLAELYQGEKGLISRVTTQDALYMAVVECLHRRGIEILPAPDDGGVVLDIEKGSGWAPEFPKEEKEGRP